MNDAETRGKLELEGRVNEVKAIYDLSNKQIVEILESLKNEIKKE